MQSFIAVGTKVPSMSETPSETGFDWNSPLYPQDTYEYEETVLNTLSSRNEYVQHRALAALVYADKLSNGSVLSQRQAEVWVLTRVGFSQRDVASLLELDASTVSDYARTAERKVGDALRFATEINLSLYDEASHAMGHDIPEPNGAIQYAGEAPWGKPYRSDTRRNLSRLVSYETEDLWYDLEGGQEPPTMNGIRAFIDYGCAEGAVIIQRVQYTSGVDGYTTKETTRVYGSKKEVYDAELNDRDFETHLDLFATYGAVSSVTEGSSIPNPLVVYESEVSLRDAFDAVEQNLVTPESLAGMVRESQKVLVTDVIPSKQNTERQDVPDTVLQPSETWGQ